MILFCQESECYLVEAGVKLPTGFTRNIMMTLEKVNDFRRQHHNTGIYVTAYSYNSENQDDAYAYGNLYLDFDIKDLVNSDTSEQDFKCVQEDAIQAMVVLSAIFNIKEEQVRIYFSGKKGLHLIVPAVTMGLRPDKELNEIFRLIAKDIKKSLPHQTLDTQIYDKKRLFRVPCSIHPDTGLYKIPLTYKELCNLELSQIIRLASTPRAIRHGKAVYNPRAYRVVQDFYRQWEKEKQTRNMRSQSGNDCLNYTPPCVEYILEHGVYEGKRNLSVAAVASHLKQRGYSEEKAFVELKEWNGAMCSPPLKDRELAVTIQSIFRGQYKYGCQTYQEVSECDFAKCRLKKQGV